MSRVPSPRPTPPAQPEPLAAVAQALVAVAHESGVSGRFLVGLLPDSDGHQAAIDVHGLHGPVDRLLLGWHAPVEWGGAVLVCASDDGSEPAALAVDGRSRPVQVRRGLARTAPAHTSVVDLLQRALGIATPPPPLSVSQMADRVWLHRLLELVLDHPEPSTIGVAALTRRHPLRDRTPGASWRLFASGLRDPPLALPSCVVDWFDAGSYARWILRQLPEPDQAMATLSALLRPEVATVVGATMSPDALKPIPGCEAADGLASLGE